MKNAFKNKKILITGGTGSQISIEWISYEFGNRNNIQHLI